MSDWSMYEQLQDIVWDKFGENDDHIVPHPACKEGDDCVTQGDCLKKLKHEDLNTCRKNAGGKSPPKGETMFPTSKDESDRILENGSWSSGPDGLLVSGDANMSGNYYKTSNIASMGSGFCDDEAILRSRVSATDTNFTGFPVGDISPTGSDLNYFSTEDKESRDLYFGWSDIGNFEDVDKMFRSCDNTFGLGSANDEELSWFSSSSPVFNRSGDAPMPEFNSSSSDSSGLNNSFKQCEADINFISNDGTPLLTNSESGGVPNAYTTSSWASHGNDSANDCHSYDGIWFDAETESKKEPEQANSQRKLSKPRNQPEGKKKNQSLGYLTGGSMYGQHFARFPDSVPSAMQIFPSSNIPKHSQNQSVSSLIYPYNLYVFPHCKHVSHQNPITTTGGHIKLENKMDGLGHTALDNKVSFESKEKADAYGVNSELPAELNSLNVQESSCMSSVLSNEISLETTSFLQLQYVMEQLDNRTKLCIRDSLYRLARNAEQRHIPGDVNGSNKDQSGFMTADEPDICLEFMDIEADKNHTFEKATNRIDRSIAHLLFHRAADSSTKPTNDALSFDSRTTEEAAGDDINLMVTDQ